MGKMPEAQNFLIPPRNIALMHPKGADGMANSVDPDQTASSEAV